jgi:hypothetical protein
VERKANPSARSLLSSAVAGLIFFILLSRLLEEFQKSSLEIALLKVEAKCPGLPYGQYSGGPDYINIAIDIGLAVVAGVFIYLTIRDIRRKRKLSTSPGQSEETPE